MKELVHGDFQGTGQLFERLTRWNRMPVFSAGDKTAQQAGSFFHVALREFFRFAQFLQAVADHHSGLLEQSIVRPYGINACAGPKFIPKPVLSCPPVSSPNPRETMKKSELYAALRTELHRHDFSTFVSDPPCIAQGGRGV